MFSLFALTSLVTDTINMSQPSRNSWYFVERFLFENGNEKLVLENPRFVQITVGYVSALLFDVFYLVLIYAFVPGQDSAPSRLLRGHGRHGHGRVPSCRTLGRRAAVSQGMRTGLDF